jgi:hypothetical protein
MMMLQPYHSELVRIPNRPTASLLTLFEDVGGEQGFKSNWLEAKL